MTVGAGSFSYEVDEIRPGDPHQGTGFRGLGLNVGTWLRHPGPITPKIVGFI